MFQLLADAPPHVWSSVFTESRFGTIRGKLRVRVSRRYGLVVQTREQSMLHFFYSRIAVSYCALSTVQTSQPQCVQTSQLQCIHRQPNIQVTGTL